ncbi:MAG: DinB family protein [Flavobacteriales bacterium]|nr:DinB family protein [Flavobacteriales bacterium]MBP6642778.1 DinB family protein [Flavobacteriales bacterium]MBP7156047.1 DinB family protein [Flavobacteriales bacterium]
MMTLMIAKHFREVHFGGNWTSVNLRDTLKDVTWQEATTKREGFNTIAVLTFHISYFIDAVLVVLEDGPLDAHDKFSFTHPPITNEVDWQRMLEKVWSDAERFATLVEQLPEDHLHQDMADSKYGTWYRNLHGIIEHTHYHMGQIVILKKLLRT